MGTFLLALITQLKVSDRFTTALSAVSKKASYVCRDGVTKRGPPSKKIGEGTF